MDHQELVRTMNRDQLLSLVELLSLALRCPDEDLEDLESNMCLSDEAFECCKNMSDYQRLKLMQLATNTLVHETEQSVVQHFQTLLALEAEG